jgi:hypothetical protein
MAELKKLPLTLCDMKGVNGETLAPKTTIYRAPVNNFAGDFLDQMYNNNFCHKKPTVDCKPPVIPQIPVTVPVKLSTLCVMCPDDVQILNKKLLVIDTKGLCKK